MLSTVFFMGHRRGADRAFARCVLPARRSVPPVAAINPLSNTNIQHPARDSFRDSHPTSKNPELQPMPRGRARAGYQTTKTNSRTIRCNQLPAARGRSARAIGSHRIFACGICTFARQFRLCGDCTPTKKTFAA